MECWVCGHLGFIRFLFRADIGGSAEICHSLFVNSHLPFEKVKGNSTRAVISARKQSATNDFNDKIR